MLGGGLRRNSKFKNQNSKLLNKILEFEEIISLDNLLLAWQEFIRGKRKRQDVLEFQANLMENLFQLHDDLAKLSYTHGPYKAFRINDPKPRQIHKSSVKDRLLHHAVYRILYSFFDLKFAPDSFSCRNRKGTHKAIYRLRSFMYQVSQNNTRTCRVLKCDIRKFFENIDHEILLDILRGYIKDKNIIWLLKEILNSFSSSPGRGLPLGNLTSQLFVNIYMNEFDQFVKHKLKAKFYIRYADDFIFMSGNKNWLLNIIKKTQSFLRNQLGLDLHPDKVFIKTITSGIDFLGWVNFPNHRILRTSTKRRMIKKLGISNKPEVVASYSGLISHGNTYKLRKNLKKTGLI